MNGWDFVPLVGGVVKGFIQKNAADKSQQALEGNRYQGEQQLTGAYNQAQGYQNPYSQQGLQDYRTMSQMTNAGQFNATPYNYQMQQAPQDQFQFKADPAYQFRQQQGMNAINSGAAAGGMQLSGATLKALNRYGQNFASNEYNNSFNRFTNQRDFNQDQYQFGTTAGMSNELNRYNSANQQGQQSFDRYNTLANYGQSAGNNLSDLATGYGQNMYSTYADRGNIHAGGITGRANAWSGMTDTVSQFGAQQSAEQNANKSQLTSLLALV